jgi:hypothetical protein
MLDLTNHEQNRLSIEYTKSLLMALDTEARVVEGQL